MKLSKVDARIMSLMFRSGNWLDSFTIYRRLRLTFADFSQSIAKLSENNLIDENDARFRINKKGKELLLKMKNSYQITGEKSWRMVPEDYRRNQLESGDLYIPKRSLLDARHFKID